MFSEFETGAERNKNSLIEPKDIVINGFEGKFFNQKNAQLMAILIERAQAAESWTIKIDKDFYNQHKETLELLEDGGKEGQILSPFIVFTRDRYANNNELVETRDGKYLLKITKKTIEEIQRIPDPGLPI